MSIFWIIVVTIIGLVVWHKIGNQQINQVVLTINWLWLLMYSCQDRDEFEKLLWKAYIHDSNTLPTDDFNRKWETICKASKVHPHKRDFGGVMCISESVITLISENVYDNPENKRQVKALRERFPKNISLKELKEQAGI